MLNTSNNCKEKNMLKNKMYFEVPKMAPMYTMLLKYEMNTCYILCTVLICFCLSGVKGEQGLMGVPGMTGVKGERGPVGPKGITGPPGRLCNNVPNAHQISCICALLSWTLYNPSRLQVFMGSKGTRVLLHFPSEFQERGALQDDRVSKDQRE